MTTGPADRRRRLSSSPFKAPPAMVIDTFAVGDRVTHDKHGLGTVVASSDATVTVRFGTEAIRVASPYLKLTKL